MSDTRQEEFEAAARHSYTSFVEDLNDGTRRLQRARGEDFNGGVECADCNCTDYQDSTTRYRSSQEAILCDDCMRDRGGDSDEDEFPAEPEDEDAIYEEFDPLCITKVMTLEIELSTGGPASRLVLSLDEDGDVDEAVYKYQDWFQPWKEFHLSRDEIAQVIELYRIDGYYYVHGG